MKIKGHNEWWCKRYWAAALPDEKNNCSLCGAKLHTITKDEGEALVNEFEDQATERMLNEHKLIDFFDEDELETYKNLKTWNDNYYLFHKK